MIVIETLCGVQNLFRRHPQLADRGYQVTEVPGIGLVGTDVLRGADGVKGDAEPLVAAGEAVTIDVGEYDELVVTLQVLQCRRGIGKRRPRRHRLAEGNVR